MLAFRAALLSAAALTLFPLAAGAEDTAPERHPLMRVDYDQAAVVRLDRSAKTVVVGNAAIADAMLVSDKTIYVQGRMFGNTNIIALDSEGNEVLNLPVTVGAPMLAQVTIYRGPKGQQNMACASHCERTVTQGDAEMDPMYQNADKKVEISKKSADLATDRR
jgi:Flp pilus assembly secretin CpaC